MSDPTQNVPWRVQRVFLGDGSESWQVLDSIGEHLGYYGWEALARMIAAGSVARELYAACKDAVEQLRDSGILHGAADTLNDALALAAPLIEKETP